MPADLRTVATVRHRDVAPWKRDGFTRALLRRDHVSAVFHGTRHLEVTFLADRATAQDTLHAVVTVTRFPVDDVHWRVDPSGPGDGQPP